MRKTRFYLAFSIVCLFSYTFAFSTNSPRPSHQSSFHTHRPGLTRIVYDLISQFKEELALEYLGRYANPEDRLRKANGGYLLLWTAECKNSYREAIANYIFHMILSNNLTEDNMKSLCDFISLEKVHPTCIIFMLLHIVKCYKLLPEDLMEDEKSSYESSLKLSIKALMRYVAQSTGSADSKTLGLNNIEKVKNQ